MRKDACARNDLSILQLDLPDHTLVRFDAMNRGAEYGDVMLLQLLALFIRQFIRSMGTDRIMICPTCNDFGKVHCTRTLGNHNKRLIPQFPSIAIWTDEGAFP